MGKFRNLIITIFGLSSSNKMEHTILNFSLDKWTSGEMTMSVPEQNRFWRMLGWSERLVTLRIISTDYRNYEISYRCNQDSWLYSSDEYVLGVRNLANGQSIFDSLAKSDVLKADVFKMFTKVNHTSQNCKNITFTVLTKPLHS